MRITGPGIFGIVLGFALGGFFDGILLHQILQWHHLLSLVPGLADIRTQVLWDGYFHALMYVIAATGLLGLWRAQRRAKLVNGRFVISALLVGFGLWHVIDSILSHWVLGIHRIRIGSDNPLLWDLIWFFAFGIIPLVIGWMLARDSGGGAAHSAKKSAASLMLLALLTIGAGSWSLRPPSDQPFTTVVFRAGVEPKDVFASLAATGARLVWTDANMDVVVVHVRPERRFSFYGQGAIFVGGSGLPAGCFDWSRV